jgi:soluble lytic murein transglycosylase-like protein
MLRPQAIVLPAAIFGCILVGWLGTIAAVNRPVSSQTSSNTSIFNQPGAELTQHSTTKGQSEVTTACSLNKKYPTPILQWCSLIDTSAVENGLPADLVAAVMLEESGGDPRAYSISGAVGLMQVMPRDGLAASFLCAAGPCFANRPTMDQLFDPGFNIAYGTRMLAGLVEKYGGIRDGLLHYGPMDVGYDYADIVLAIWKNNS